MAGHFHWKGKKEKKRRTKRKKYVKKRLDIGKEKRKRKGVKTVKGRKNAKKSLTVHWKGKKEKKRRKKRKKYVKMRKNRLDTFIGKEKRIGKGIKTVKST